MSADSTRYREEVETHGLSRTHKQTMAWIRPGARVLEVGCASGYIGRLLIESKGCKVTGVELDPNAAREARSNGLEVLEGSLEDAKFRASLPSGFDYVLASDVLEHLREPAPVLNDFKRWLAPDGKAIIAVPNIATWSMRHQLFFRGDFEYQETGILDRTHVHFFTWNTLHKLVDAQGWKVVDTMVEEWQFPVLRDVLVDAPQNVRTLVEQLGSSDNRFLKSATRPLTTLTKRVEKLSHGIANRVFQAWPNLTASHIALLLEPPPKTNGSR